MNALTNGMRTKLFNEKKNKMGNNNRGDTSIQKDVTIYRISLTTTSQVSTSKHGSFSSETTVKNLSSFFFFFGRLFFGGGGREGRLPLLPYKSIVTFLLFNHDPERLLLDGARWPWRRFAQGNRSQRWRPNTSTSGTFLKISSLA